MFPRRYRLRVLRLAVQAKHAATGVLLHLSTVVILDQSKISDLSDCFVMPVGEESAKQTRRWTSRVTFSFCWGDARVTYVATEKS